MLRFCLNNGLGLSFPFCFQAKSKPPIITRSDTEASAAVPRILLLLCFFPLILVFWSYSKSQIICSFITFLLISKSNVYLLVASSKSLAICLLRSLKSCMRCINLYTKKWSWCLNGCRGAREVNKLFISTTESWLESIQTVECRTEIWFGYFVFSFLLFSVILLKIVIIVVSGGCRWKQWDVSLHPMSPIVSLPCVVNGGFLD